MTEPTTDTATARPLSGRELSAWRAFVETVSDLQNALETDLAPTGLTLGDYQVLVFLSEAEQQSMRMCDLASSLQLSPSGLTRRLDGLVRHGLVDRQPSVADRRVMLAVLTDEGVGKLADAYPVHLGERAPTDHRPARPRRRRRARSHLQPRFSAALAADREP